MMAFTIPSKSIREILAFIFNVLPHHHLAIIITIIIITIIIITIIIIIITLL
jgi:hypothetical protein